MESSKNVLRNIGRRVIETRVARGWTQEECAERVKVDARQLRRIQAGEVNMTIATLVRVAQRLGVATASLFEPASYVEPRRPGRPARDAPHDGSAPRHGLGPTPYREAPAQAMLLQEIGARSSGGGRKQKKKA